MNKDGAKLSVLEKVGYGFGDLASNLFWQMFAIFVAKFYTDVFMLSAATLGTMLLATRVLDAFVDPMVGTIADRTNTRWGHFRPYLVWMAIPMAATATLTFTTPDLEGGAKVAYAYVTLSLMMVTYSAINIPYSALLGVLTPDSEERTSASSYRFVMALLPVFVVVNTAIPLANHFGGSDNSPRGWQMTMLLYSSVAVLLFFACFALTRERVPSGPREDSSLRNDLRDLLRNKPWMVLSAVGIAALTYSNIRNTVAIYYFQYVVPGGAEYFGPVMTTGAFAFIAGVMATAPLAKRYGKRNFYMVSMTLTAIATFAFFFVPPSNLPLVWGMNTLINVLAAPTAPLVWAMYADTADYSEWRAGRRATGLVFSASSFAQKLGWAIGGAGVGWLLAFYGYVPNVAQSERTVHGIVLMMSLIPAAAAVIAVAALWFYELDKSTVERMTAELQARRSRPDGLEAPNDRTPPKPDATRSPGRAATTVAARASAAGRTAMPSGTGSVRAGERAHPSAPRTGVTPPEATGTGPLPLTVAQRAALDDEFDRLIGAGVHGLCFSPYVVGQVPGDPIGEAQIRARLGIIRPHARWVRTFSCTEGHEQTPRIAHELGFRTLVGAWLGTDRAINEREVAAAIELARGGHADLLAIGNEVLLREDLGEDELLGYIERVRRAVPDVPVGYVDAYYLFELHPRIAAACDVVFANCYPFWEGCPREGAVAYMQSMYARARRLRTASR